MPSSSSNGDSYAWIALLTQVTKSPPCSKGWTGDLPVTSSNKTTPKLHFSVTFMVSASKDNVIDIYLDIENALAKGLEFMRIWRGHATQRIIKYKAKQVRSWRLQKFMIIWINYHVENMNESLNQNFIQGVNAVLNPFSEDQI